MDGDAATTANVVNNAYPMNVVDANIISTASVPVPVMPFAKPFPDISKIEVFGGENFKRWQERIFSVLDIRGVTWVLTDSKTDTNIKSWTYKNKVCRHSIISTLSNELFDVYCSYKEAKEIWESMITKYTAEDAGKQKFVIGKFYHWEMMDEKDIKIQINEYHKLFED